MELFIAICDDSENDLKHERELIENAAPNGFKWEIDAFSMAEDMLGSAKIYDMAFLDVEMKGINGIETADMLHKRNPDCLIFFITNHDNYMDEALNKHAFRFWVKPLNVERLKYGIVSAINEINNNRKYILVNSGKILKKIYAKDIIYVYCSDRLTHIVTVNGIVDTRDAFRNIIVSLPTSEFYETHKGVCVNMNYITDYDKSHIICAYNGENYEIYISRRKFTSFEKAFSEWGGRKR